MHFVLNCVCSYEMQGFCFNATLKVALNHSILISMKGKCIKELLHESYKSTEMLSWTIRNNDLIMPGIHYYERLFWMHPNVFQWMFIQISKNVVGTAQRMQKIRLLLIYACSCKSANSHLFSIIVWLSTRVISWLPSGCWYFVFQLTDLSDIVQ